MKAYLKSTGIYIPAKFLTNEDVAKIVDTSDDWIYSHTGIKKRHIAEPTESAADLGYASAVNALKKAKISAQEIDFILVATSTPDYLSFPSTACLIQEKLCASKAGAMDITAACSGFAYGVETARAYIESSIYKNILVIGTEIYSRIVNWNDRNTCVLFGDGAGCALISRKDSATASEIIDGFLRSDGSGAQSLYRPAGGSKKPFAQDTSLEDNFIKMDGKSVYYFAVKAVGEIINTLCEKNSISIDDISWIVSHQANSRILDAAASRFGVPQEKFFKNMDEYANTSAASIPIALEEMHTKGLLKPGDLIITSGFGGGLTYGGNLIRI